MGHTRRGGVDVALLVVAADEGVMPQTREHVDICTLLGVRRGVLVVARQTCCRVWARTGSSCWRRTRSLLVGTLFEGRPWCLELSRPSSTSPAHLVAGISLAPESSGADAPPSSRWTALSAQGPGWWTGTRSLRRPRTRSACRQACQGLCASGLEVHQARVSAALAAPRSGEPSELELA